MKSLPLCFITGGHRRPATGPSAELRLAETAELMSSSLAFASGCSLSHSRTCGQTASNGSKERDKCVGRCSSCDVSDALHHRELQLAPALAALPDDFFARLPPVRLSAEALFGELVQHRQDSKPEPVEKKIAHETMLHRRLRRLAEPAAHSGRAATDRNGLEVEYRSSVIRACRSDCTTD
jgi:hypothetical protein